MKPLVRVLVGPTAAGKTRAATAVARRLDGVVVTADARQVFRGLDVATGKEGEAATFDLPGIGRVPGRVLDGVPHLGIDLADPAQEFTAARWHAWAHAAVDALARAGRAVVVSGGTGLYVEALVRGFRFPPTDPNVRAHVAAHLAPSEGPRRRAVRREEIARLGAVPAAAAPDWAFRIVLLDPSRERLRQAIEGRIRSWFASEALFEETRRLFSSPDRRAPALTAIGYAEAHAILDGRLSRDDAIRLTIARTWDYSRRQRTYFRRRFPEATRVATTEEAEEALLADTIINPRRLPREAGP